MVVLSPYDKFDFTVSQGDADRPTMSWKNDNSCVIGPQPAELSLHQQKFPPHVAPLVMSDEQMSVGHLEVLGLATLNDVCLNNLGEPQGVSAASCGSPLISAAAAAKHGANGTPANCDVLRSLLGTQQNVYTLKQISWGSSGSAGAVLGTLTGRYVITDKAGGIEAGADAIELGHTNYGVEGGGGSDGLGLLSAQSNRPCIGPENKNPTGFENCTAQYSWDIHEYDHPHFGEMPHLGALEHALTASNLAGDWSNNPDNYVGVDWIVSFPTKYAYLDYRPKSKCHNSDDDDGTDDTKTWCLMNPNPGWRNSGDVEPDLGVWSFDNTTDTCLSGNVTTLYGQDEQATSETSVSPEGTEFLDLCKEVNIFALAGSGQTPRASVIQTSDDDHRPTISGGLNAVRGWALLNLGWTIDPNQDPDVVEGGGVTGEIFTTRATVAPENNNGSLTDLKKDVETGTQQQNF
jgi:hypothetical protein